MDGEGANFFAPEGVVKEDGQNRAVAFAFEGGGGGSLEQPFGVVIGESRRFAFVSPFLGPFDIAGRVMGEYILLD